MKKDNGFNGLNTLEIILLVGKSPMYTYLSHISRKVSNVHLSTTSYETVHKLHQHNIVTEVVRRSSERANLLETNSQQLEVGGTIKTQRTIV